MKLVLVIWRWKCLFFPNCCINSWVWPPSGYIHSPSHFWAWRRNTWACAPRRGQLVHVDQLDALHSVLLRMAPSSRGKKGQQVDENRARKEKQQLCAEPSVKPAVWASCSENDPADRQDDDEQQQWKSRSCWLVDYFHQSNKPTSRFHTHTRTHTEVRSSI